MFTKEEQELTRPVYEVLKKLDWEWTPERGEQFIYRGNVHIVEAVERALTREGWIITYYNGEMVVKIRKVWSGDCLPLLYWEKIEKILKERRWSRFQFSLWSNAGVRATSFLAGSKLTCSGRAKTRQEAVMRAIEDKG